MKNKIIILIICFSAFSLSTKAQYQDLGGWYSASASFNLNKKWGFELKEELRFNSNSLKLNKHLTDLQVNFKHTKWLKYGLGTRYYFDKTKDGFWENALRLNFDLMLKFKYEKFSILSRTRLQSSLNPKNTIGRMHSDEALIREKITIRYNLKKYNIKPFISGELFVEDYFVFGDITGNQKPKIKFESNNFRLKLGVDYKVNKRNYIKFSYGYQQELNQIFNQRDFLISIKYTYKLIIKKRENDKIN